MQNGKQPSPSTISTQGHVSYGKTSYQINVLIITPWKHYSSIRRRRKTQLRKKEREENEKIEGTSKSKKNIEIIIFKMSLEATQAQELIANTFYGNKCIINFFLGKKTITLRGKKNFINENCIFFIFLYLVMCHEPQTWGSMVVEKMYVIYHYAHWFYLILFI